MLAESCASVSVILKLNKEFIFQLPARVILIRWNKQIHKSPTPNQRLTTGPTGQGEGAARTTPWPRTAAGQSRPAAGKPGRGQRARRLGMALHARSPPTSATQRRDTCAAVFRCRRYTNRRRNKPDGSRAHWGFNFAGRRARRRTGGGSSRKAGACFPSDSSIARD